MPTGKIRFFDEERGFGFIASEDGTDVHMRASAVDSESPTPRAGAKVEFEVVDSKKGPSAMRVKVLSQPATLVKANRKKPEDMIAIIEDVIKVLDSTSSGLRRGHWPDRREASSVAKVLRAVAGDIEG
ncbi:MAG: cold shock domain-containing protein [Micrococcales bacterium]|nr:cold shock domain-containing protein [Micrococcales bacterium]